MMILTMRLGDEIRIGPHITIEVTRVGLEVAGLGITAPREIRVDRAEIHARRLRNPAPPAAPIPPACPA